jgi:septal ring factor EnvC (AmiA/AmiB activator)
MNQAIETTEARTATIIHMCDQTGCKEPAKFAYTWEWGESGKCCGTHQFVLNQTAGNIERKIQFVPLDSGIAAPMQRDERIAMHARALTLEAELVEAQVRGLELYNQNVQLTAQVQALTVGKRELEAQVKRFAEEIQAVGHELEARKAEVGELGDEAGRLRVLIQRPPVAVKELEAKLAAANAELDAQRAELEAHRAELQTVGAGAGEDPPKGKSKNPAK